MRPVFPFPISRALPLQLRGLDLDVRDLEKFSAWLAVRRGESPALIGGYGEDRSVYRGSSLFASGRSGDEEPRTIHLGVDVWTDAGTPVAAPRDGRVHSFANNSSFGDYGGTVILEHDVDGGKMHALYGHLALCSLEGKTVGAVVEAGEVFAWLGAPQENGGWPPHLHFQLIVDPAGYRGDYPGVARASERELWLRRCPDPVPWLV